MFIGVEFHDEEGGGLALINEKWLTPRKNQTWWPPHKHNDKFNKSLRKGDTPQTDTWKLYKLKRSFFKESDFTKAQKKLKIAEYNSDVQTEAEVSIQKRKVKHPRRLDESDSSDQSIFETSPIFIKKTCIENRSKTTQFNEGIGVEQNILSGSNNSPNYKDPSYNDVSESLLKKILNYVIMLKNQNEQIIEALKNITSTSVTNVAVSNVTKDIPVKLPIQSVNDLEILDKYLEIGNNADLLTSYLKTIGGSDPKNKANIVLRKLISNAVAVKFSFLGSRQEKKAFSKLTLHSVIINALLTDDFKEKDINDCIKMWLKHAPKRLSIAAVKLQT